MTEEQIFDIIDGTADTATLAQHQRLLTTDAAYRARFERLESLENELQSLETDAPSMRFTQNLMERVKPPRPVTEDNASRIYVWASAAFLVFILGILLQGGVHFSIQDTLTETAAVDRWVGIAFSSQVIQISLIIVSLMVLYFFDVKILKPYFAAKESEKTAV